MRLKIDIEKPICSDNKEILQAWIKSHHEGQRDYFVAVCPDFDAAIFQFEFNSILSCDYLFIFDTITKELTSFETNGKGINRAVEWIFSQCTKYFPLDYEILM